MNSPALDLPPDRAKKMPAMKKVNNLTYWIYIYFIIDFFLHLSGRIPSYGRLRPTLLLVFILTILLVGQWKVLARRGNGPICRSILHLLLYLALSLPLVSWPGSVVRDNFKVFLQAIVFFFFTVSILDSPKRLRFFLFLFIALQVFRVLEPLYLNITEDYWGAYTYMGGTEFELRLAGAPADIINANELGFVIVTAFTFLHFLVLRQGWLGKIVYFILVPLLMYALVLTMSRGAMLALGAVVVIIVREARHKIPILLAVLLLAAVAWVNMDSSQQDRYLSLVGLSDTNNAKSSAGRLNGIVAELNIGLERPLVGHGLGTAQEAKARHFSHPRVSHSLLAELFIEIGLVGAVFFFRFIFQINHVLKVLRKQLTSLGVKKGWSLSLFQAFSAAFFMFLVYSINYWGLSQHYWYLLGGLVAAFERVTKHQLARARETNPRTYNE